MKGLGTQDMNFIIMISTRTDGVDIQVERYFPPSLPDRWLTS